MTTDSPHGLDLFGDPIAPVRGGKLSEEFLVPPMSVLSSRDGWWQDRKRAWIALGLRGDEARTCAGNSAWNDLRLHPRVAESSRKIAALGDGPTVFDPVLCELAYRWFAPPGGQVLDPFAGGSVRGVLAGWLGLRYWGCDLRAEQVAANEPQRDAILGDKASLVRWWCGDALALVPEAPEADFVFSCPPYGDLERYSDDPRDLSTMDYHAFVAAYRRVILRCAERLRPDRFACFVVGDFRDSRGFYRGFVGDTVRAFAEVGMPLYNDAVLVTSVASASMRARGSFASGRKLTKTHQNVLVFVKGDPRKAAVACVGTTTERARGGIDL